MAHAQADEIEAKLERGDEVTPGDVKGWEWVLLQKNFEAHLREQSIPALAALGEIEDVEHFYPGCETFLRQVIQDAPFKEGFWKHPRWPRLVRLASRFLVVSRRNADWPELHGIMPHTHVLPRARAASVILQRIVATQDSDVSLEYAIEESFSPRPFWGGNISGASNRTSLLLLSIFVGLEEGGFWSEKIVCNESHIHRWLDETLSRQYSFDYRETEPDASIFTIMNRSRRSVMEERLEAFLRLYSVDNAWIQRRDGGLLFFWNETSRSIVFTTNVDPSRVISIATQLQAQWAGFTHSGEWVTWLKIDRATVWMQMAQGLAHEEFDEQANVMALLNRAGANGGLSILQSMLSDSQRSR